MTDSVPPHYAATTRTVLRYVVIMTIFGFLSGVLFQESSKKLPDEAVLAGVGLDTTLSLALVHGHVIVTAVLLPLALITAMFLARAAGGREMRPRWMRALTRGYLPLVSVTIALMLYKGYHTLLSVRGGEMDLLAIDAAYFGGQTMVRHLVYGVTHTGMFLTLGAFLIELWRSLRPA